VRCALDRTVTGEPLDPPAELRAAVDAWLDQASGDTTTNARLAQAITGYARHVADLITDQLFGDPPDPDPDDPWNPPDNTVRCDRCGQPWAAHDQRNTDGIRTCGP
jgi:hypothetical protein